MKRRILTVCIVFLMLLSVFGTSCSQSRVDPKEDGKLKIVCSLGFADDFCRELCSGIEEEYEIVTLLRSGTDAHSYEPTYSDIGKLSGADIFVYLGGVKDEVYTKLIPSAENEALTVVSLTDHVTLYEEEIVTGMQHSHGGHDHGEHSHDEHDHGEHSHDDDCCDEHSDEHLSGHEVTDNKGNYDEHIWLSLKNAKKIVKVLEGVICEKLSLSDAQRVKDNSEDYTSKLDELDRDFESFVAGSQKKPLVFADRFPFRYLTEDYGIEYFAAFPGCSSDINASFQTVNFLINKVKDENISHVFVVDGGTGDIAEVLHNECGSDIFSLNSMQKSGKSHQGYYESMKKNLMLIMEALG